MKSMNNIPDMKNNSYQFLEKLYNTNAYDLVLFKARDKRQAKKWLKKNNINKFFKDVTNIKRPASIYLDDRSIQFKGDFDETLNEIETFKPYWK